MQTYVYANTNYVIMNITLITCLNLITYVQAIYFYIAQLLLTWKINPIINEYLKSNLGWKKSYYQI